MTKPTDTNSKNQPEQDNQPIPEADLNSTEENKITKLTASSDNTDNKNDDSLTTTSENITKIQTQPQEETTVLETTASDSKPKETNDHHTQATVESNITPAQVAEDPKSELLAAKKAMKAAKKTIRADRRAERLAKKAEKIERKQAKTAQQTSAGKLSAATSASSSEITPTPISLADFNDSMKSKKSNLVFRSVVIGLLTVSLICSAASLTYCIWDFFTDDNKTVNIQLPGQDGNSVNFTEGSIADVAAKVAPGVVSIVTQVQTTSFFGQISTSTAAGTGMIVTKDGYVLTNKHVISGANAIQIVLDDGTTYDDIELVGTDPLNDVAYLKIKNASNLPTVTLGDSKTITAGQRVIAIGNALGQFQNTITNGIISGTGRSITATSGNTTETLTDMIQTDAAINSGNSGGPLVNAAGEVIGINTATSTDADGIGFAIPISSVKGMLNNIIKNGTAERAYIGVYYVTITPDVAKAYDLPVSSGAYLYSSSQYKAIIDDGPATKAGLKEKDIITKINDIEVGSAGSVSTLIGEYMPGETVKLTILRDGKEQTINITLGSNSTATKAPQN